MRKLMQQYADLNFADSVKDAIHNLRTHVLKVAAGRLAP
jgi:hypothetical protein